MPDEVRFWLASVNTGLEAVRPLTFTVPYNVVVLVDPEADAPTLMLVVEPDEPNPLASVRGCAGVFSRLAVVESGPCCARRSAIDW